MLVCALLCASNSLWLKPTMLSERLGVPMPALPAPVHSFTMDAAKDEASEGKSFGKQQGFARAGGGGGGGGGGAAAAAAAAPLWAVGHTCEAPYEGIYYVAVIDAMNVGACTVTFYDYWNTETVDISTLRAVGTFTAAGGKKGQGKGKGKVAGGMEVNGND